ncbi:ABC transporter substrate-binding protein [Mesorhizobium sp. M0243]|uniref:ABC transporter substrate-binding protein n=1 Tax=Mesorhizobium sp. M0243 TaxID=2956925 RepID=UPI00333C1D51
MISRLLRTIMLSLAATLLTLTGLAAQEAGGTLNLIVQPEPPTVNIGVNRLGPTTYVGNKIYESLLTYSADLKPLPRLAQSWSISDDGLVYTFNLRRDVKWHDGQPFTAKDVVFSFKKFLPALQARSRLNLAEVKDIATPDDHTVVFTLKAPYPAFIYVHNTAVLPAHLYEGVSDFRTAEANSKFIGTGPFKFAEWKKGSFIHLVRNPDYWDAGKPHLNDIFFHVIPDANSRAIAFETGQVDVLRAGDIENFDITRLAGLDGVQLTEAGWEFLQPVGYIHLNNRHKPLDDARVRRAIAHAIDRQFIIDTIFGGFGHETNGPLSRLSRFKDTSVETKYEFDLAKANAILDEAGLKPDANGVRFELQFVPLPYGELWQREAEYIREALTSVGIKVNIVATDVPGWFKRLTTFDYDLAENFVYTTPDPAIGISYAYTTLEGDNAGTTGGNVHGYSNPEVDRLLADAAHENDFDKRKALYSQAQKIISADVPLIWTHDIVFPTLYRTKVHNLIATGLGTDENFADVWLAK